MDEFILGKTAIGNPNISVIYLDDNWQNYSEARAGSPYGGPTEEDSHCIADMGLTQADVNAQTQAWEGTMQAVQDAVIKAGGWSWAWFLAVKTAPKGVSACTAYFRANDTKAYADAPIQMSMAYSVSRACTHCSANYTYTSPMEDLATFLLVRGAYGWLGAGWAGCNAYPAFYPGFEQDYGVPMESSYKETTSGVFERQWTQAQVSFNCNTHKATITMKSHL